MVLSSVAVKGLAGVLAATLVFGAVQTYRLNSKDTRIAELEKSIAETSERLTRANNKLLTEVAKASDDADTRFRKEEREKADVLDRVADAVARQCVQQPAEDRVRVPVPEAPRMVTDATERAGNDPDRGSAFADAIARDLRYCRSELNRLSRLQEWVLSVSE